MLRISYYLLTRKEMYVDLGEDYFDKQKQQSIVRYSVRRLENLGYNVQSLNQMPPNPTNNLILNLGAALFLKIMSCVFFSIVFFLIIDFNFHGSLRRIN